VVRPPSQGFINYLLSELRNLPRAPLHMFASPELFAIELPFLQLILQRLWRKMPRRGDRAFDSNLPTDEHNIGSIVEAHVRDRLDALSLGERQLASDLFHYLVAPSGGKFAYLPEDLTPLARETAGRNIETGDVSLLLRQLAEGNTRVLRQSSGRFELFHDV
jgi:hypothetical protein